MICEMESFENVKFRHGGERNAAEILLRSGHKIVCVNFHVRFAEIDLITAESDSLHFIEVKSYASGQFIHPLETLTGHKINKMRQAAEIFISNYYRFISQKNRVIVSKEIIPDIVALQPVFDLIWIKKDGKFEYFEKLF